MQRGKDAIASRQIEDQIYTVRGKRVMMDADLARLYGVTTKRLNEQVRRNADRFPEDFAFNVTNQEFANLRSQIATSSEAFGGHGGRRYQPRVFTEHGAIMAAAVLNTPRAVEVSVFVVRAFVKLRELAMAHKEIRAKLDDLERKVTGHDQAIAGLINAIRELMTPPRAEEEANNRLRPLGGQVGQIKGSEHLIPLVPARSRLIQDQADQGVRTLDPACSRPIPPNPGSSVLTP